MNILETYNLKQNRFNRNLVDNFTHALILEASNGVTNFD